MFSVALAWLLAAAPAIDNPYVRVARGEALCASASTAGCGARVVVALEPIEIGTAGGARRLTRGQVAVFEAGESYSPPAGSGFFEVAIRPGHPPALAPPTSVAPQKNALVHENDDFFVFEDRLEVGDTRDRHSHSQRVVIQLNRTQLRQWPDGAPEVQVETVPEKPSFSPPVVHKVQNLGPSPLYGIVIEFKPAPPR